MTYPNTCTASHMNSNEFELILLRPSETSDNVLFFTNVVLVKVSALQLYIQYYADGKYETS